MIPSNQRRPAGGGPFGVEAVVPPDDALEPPAGLEPPASVVPTDAAEEPPDAAAVALPPAAGVLPPDGPPDAAAVALPPAAGVEPPGDRMATVAFPPSGAPVPGCLQSHEQTNSNAQSPWASDALQAHLYFDKSPVPAGVTLGFGAMGAPPDEALPASAPPAVVPAGPPVALPPAPPAGVVPAGPPEVALPPAGPEGVVPPDFGGGGPVMFNTICFGGESRAKLYWSVNTMPFRTPLLSLSVIGTNSPPNDSVTVSASKQIRMNILILDRP